MRLRFLLGLSLATVLLALLPGCTSRTVIAFDDHPRHPVTAIQAVRTNSYLFGSSNTHEFWNCIEKGDTLVCKPLCGGKTDLQCPSVNAHTGGGSTNVR